MKWKPSTYVLELSALIESGVAKFLSEHPRTEVFSTTVYTGLSSCRSHLAFDTFANAKRVLAKVKKRHASYQGDRDWNSAEFKVPCFHEVQHHSIPEHWESDTGGDCENEIIPAAISAVGSMLSCFEKLKLHPKACVIIAAWSDDVDYLWFRRRRQWRRGKVIYGGLLLDLGS
ncbi:MAG: hypothetical protein WD768_16490 [Phycisphaeraceae bacterium]